ncbi:rRNA maturation RNase YbeY [Bacillus kwashiorkori]|uniref:rRNA maturation RNase YbeY n=1 Tax=Bacillus kwashiorkori TaxID=1522318 RepID=UPI0007811D73|nr:rRNA maturation RNase YbeY [Bacillus kwashiorkori]
MTLVIDFLDETNSISESEQRQILSLLSLAAKKENVENESEVSLIFVNNERIQEINKEYRKKDYPTDVISFALEEQTPDEITIIGGDMPRILGDIIISVPKAKEQAEEYGHSFMRELGFLAVHGFLHLLGYDHETDADEKIMFGKQEEILNELGLFR